MKFTNKMMICVSFGFTLLTSGCYNQTEEILLQQDTRQPNTSQLTDSNAQPEKKYKSPLSNDAPVYTVATEFDFPPFVSKNSAGDIIGLDVDLIRAIGETQGFKVEFTSMPFPEVLPSLSSGKYDIAISGIHAFNGNEKFLMSAPYLRDEIQIVSKADKPINDISELAGKNIGMQSGGDMIEFAKEKSQSNVVLRTTVYQLFGDMLRDKTDGLLVTKSTGLFFAKKFPETQIHFVDLPEEFKVYSEDVVFFVNKDQAQLLEKINKGLIEIKKNGRYDEINKKWFGDNASKLTVK